MCVVLCIAGLIITEYVTIKKSKGEVLIFRRGYLPMAINADDEEAQNQHEQPASHIVQKATKDVSDESNATETYGAHFLWDGITYDVDIKGGKKRILDDVEGWVKPGTLTALRVFQTLCI
jgi:ATP-binding cassette subfamily G (WHITE) protein 2 (PDR)